MTTLDGQSNLLLFVALLILSLEALLNASSMLKAAVPLLPPFSVPDLLEVH